MPSDPSYLKPRQYKLLRERLYRLRCPDCNGAGSFTLLRSRVATCNRCGSSFRVAGRFTKPWRQDNVRWVVEGVALERLSGGQSCQEAG